MAPRMRYMMSKIEMPDGTTEHAIIEHGRPGFVQRFKDHQDAQMMMDMMNNGMSHEEAMAACSRVGPMDSVMGEDLENYIWDVKSFDLNFGEETRNYLKCLSLGYEPFAVVESGIWLKKKIGICKQEGEMSDGESSDDARSGKTVG